MVDATVTIGYDTPWRQVEAMLCEAARTRATACCTSRRRACSRSRCRTSTSSTGWWARPCAEAPAAARRAHVQPACGDPRRVQRARRADHVAALLRRSARTEGRAARAVVRSPRNAAHRRRQEHPLASARRVASLAHLQQRAVLARMTDRQRGRSAPRARGRRGRVRAAQRSGPSGTRPSSSSAAHALEHVRGRQRPGDRPAATPAARRSGSRRPTPARR